MSNTPSVMEPDPLSIDDSSKTITFTVKGTRLDRILELSRKRRKLNEEIREFSKTVKPIEFESYHEYFVINTFKKGVSASGHVDIESLRSRNNGRYYKRIRRGQGSNSQEPSEKNQNGALSNDEDEEEDTGNNDAYDRNRFFTGASDEEETNYSPPKRVTRAQLAAKKEITKASELLEKPEQQKNAQVNQINGDISVASIIPAADSDNSIRRSSRLSQKLSESSTGYSAGSEIADLDVINIRDLYESLVPKVKEPFRRSDWVLPSKHRYTAEKQMHTKPVYEKIKVNELVNTNRIRNVLSKFEGGVAGVRKRA